MRLLGPGKVIAASHGSGRDRLARYVVSLSYGIAVQAASGVDRDDLQQVADTTLLN
ncbi:hypothetical protein [Streptomyces sp. NRRL S-37]|uniref:hypothetical protein n=1 Tax=Streptomyces sp. NRRL S-37 TaxID=1463903 RepID=UPI000AE851A7|nr:hypothetical protein [Streptomyces sp. NRRL S-37]